MARELIDVIGKGADGSEVFRLEKGEGRTGHYWFDGVNASVDVEGETGEVEEVEFVPMCTPENPVWVRFVNHWGGWEYFMFRGRKTFTIDVSRGERYELAEGDGLSSTRTAERVAGSVERILEAGVENVPWEDWKWLKEVATSGLVELWSVKRQTWLGITLKDCGADFDSEAGVGSVSLQIELLDEDWEV